MDTVNFRISKQAIASKRRREQVVSFQKKLIGIIFVFVISLIIIFGSTMITFARSESSREVSKDYISIQVQSGDNLWSIAQTYTEGFDIDPSDYIEDVKATNGLSSDNIHSGSYILVPQYSYN